MPVVHFRRVLFAPLSKSQLRMSANALGQQGASCANLDFAYLFTSPEGRIERQRWWSGNSILSPPGLVLNAAVRAWTELIPFILSILLLVRRHHHAAHQALPMDRNKPAGGAYPVRAPFSTDPGHPSILGIIEEDVRREPIRRRSDSRDADSRLPNSSMREILNARVRGQIASAHNAFIPGRGPRDGEREHPTLHQLSNEPM